MGNDWDGGFNGLDAEPPALLPKPVEKIGSTYVVPESGMYRYQNGILTKMTDNPDGKALAKKMAFKGKDIVSASFDSAVIPADAIEEDPVVFYAEQLLSSMKTWDDAPQDHRAETPRRFVNMLRQMTTRDEEFKFTTFDSEGTDEMITLGPIPFYTLCAHHVVPFFGHCWIGYVPDKKLAGLSKFPRAVKHLAKGFWVQETLTREIADYLDAKLKPLGIAVVMQAEHLCMAARGVEQPGVITRTSAMLGVFADHKRTAKSEFMEGINGRH